MMFQILTSVKIHIFVFYVRLPCSLVGGCQLLETNVAYVARRTKDITPRQLGRKNKRELEWLGTS
jgi:hypothetical protein